jgi:hypothetical protein
MKKASENTALQAELKRREICDRRVHTAAPVVMARGCGLRIVQPGLRNRYRQGV